MDSAIRRKDVGGAQVSASLNVDENGRSIPSVRRLEEAELPARTAKQREIVTNVASFPRLPRNISK